MAWRSSSKPKGLLMTKSTPGSIIREDQIELPNLKKGQSLFAAEGRLDHVPVNRKHPPDGIADERIVIHHQNPLC